MNNIQISASILSADLSNLAAVTEGLEHSGVDMLHFDVMDGHFVPNLTFGMPVLAAIDHCTNLFLDVHLMITNPLQYVEQFAKAGADLITFHLESDSDPEETIRTIHAAGAQAGIVLKPGTSWETAIPFLPMVEVVLVMTVEPGFGGQAYIPESTDKIRALRKMLNDRGLTTDIEVDGGIKKDNLEMVLDAGANEIVAGSAIFKDDIEKNTRDFMEILKKRQA